MWNPSVDFERLIDYFSKQEYTVKNGIVLHLLKLAFNFYNGETE